MRKGFLSSLTALLAGTGLALAEPPVTSDPAAAIAPNGTGQPTTVTSPRDPVPPIVDALHSPYWPDPLGKAQTSDPATAVASNGTGQPTTVTSRRDPVPPIVDALHSPYWPDPLGKAQCVAPGCAIPPAPAPPDSGAERPHHRIHVWGSAEYLVWWVKDQPLGVPLVTTGSPATLGVLGSPDTAVLFGDSDIDYHTFSGGRFTLGFGCSSNCGDLWGVEGSGFFTERRPISFLAASSAAGAPLLARPIVNALDGTETVAVVSDPGVAAGTVAVGSSSAVYGWDVNAVHSACGCGPLHVDCLVGFRYLNLSEDLDIAQNSTLLAGGTFAGNALVPPFTGSIVDQFATRNEFYGGQLGARVEYGRGCWFLSGLVKIGLGDTREVINLAGFTSGSPGGLLVVSSNSGRRTHDEFAVVPEVGINVGYQICHSVRLFMGYTFLYWSDVVRPGDQVNRTVNPNLVPASRTFGSPVGPAEPSFSFQRTDFWAQGLNFGVAFRF